MYDAKSFIFNGKCSDDYGIVIGFFDNPNYVTGLERETLHTERSVIRNRIKYYGTKYTNGITFIFSIIKKCENEFTEEESIQINEWLTKNNTPTLLHFNSDKTIYTNYYAVCTNIEDNIINGRNAKTLTFETDSPFAYSNILKKKIHVDDYTKVKLLNQSCEKYYYPKIKIIPDNEENVIIIENESDFNSLTINNISKYPNGILIDSDNYRITDTANNLIPISQFGLSDSNYTSIISINNTITNSIYFPRFVNGINTFKITGNCFIEFIMEFPRKAGSI